MAEKLSAAFIERYRDVVAADFPSLPMTPRELKGEPILFFYPDGRPEGLYLVHCLPELAAVYSPTWRKADFDRIRSRIPRHLYGPVRKAWGLRKVVPAIYRAQSVSTKVELARVAVAAIAELWSLYLTLRADLPVPSDR